MKWLRRFVILILVVFIVHPAHAQNASDAQKKIDELTAKISELQGTENSLAKQIKLLDSEIDLKTLRIESIKSSIDKLTGEIEELNREIDRLEAIKTRRLELALHRIPESYKRNRTSQFGILLFSENFSQFITKIKYLNKIQQEDSMMYRKVQNAQDAYGEKKDSREKKKTQIEVLKVQFENESYALAKQKKEKQSLLEQTRNSESVYQKLLAQALAEKAAIEKALIEGVSLGPVKQGDPIALVGNTGFPGCSTGAHLHFEVRRNNSWTDPADLLSSKSIVDDQNGGSATVGRGGWPWPLEDTVRLTQYFGKTPYSWRYAYSGGIHTGFDMISTSGNVIRAPADGTLYSSSQACGSSSVIKIKYIEHADGIVTLYLHVQ